MTCHYQQWVTAHSSADCVTRRSFYEKELSVLFMWAGLLTITHGGLFEDLWFVETPQPMDGWVGGWVGYCVGQWVGSSQITRNSIIRKLIKIIPFCLKVFVFCLHSHPIPPTQPPIPLDYIKISNNSIDLESIEIIQFCLKIWILSRLLHPWVGEWFDGWVKGWSYVKSLIIK